VEFQDLFMGVYVIYYYWEVLQMMNGSDIGNIVTITWLAVKGLAWFSAVCLVSWIIVRNIPVKTE